MSSSISKRFSLPAMTSEKHPLKLMRRSGGGKKRHHGDIIRSTMDNAAIKSVIKEKTKSPTLLRRSFDKIEELKSSKTVKKIVSKLSKSISTITNYNIEKSKNEFNTTLNNSFFEYKFPDSRATSSPSGLIDQMDESFDYDAYLDDHNSTLSTLSCDPSLFEDEKCMEIESRENRKAIRNAVKETTTSIQKLISDSIRDIKQDPGTKYNKILQQKQNENIKVLEEIHNKCLGSLDEMEEKINNVMDQKEQNVNDVIGNLRSKLEESKVAMKRLDKKYGKIMRSAESKIRRQEEELTKLKPVFGQKERADILDY